VRTAEKTGKFLQVGHQRRYSVDYHHANEMVKKGYLGKVTHLRAQWNRNGSWRRAVPDANDKNLERLINWRLYKDRSRGLMAELGSHQLDACSIFLGKVHPLAVSGVGTRSLFGSTIGDGKPNPREIDDHVFTTYEFPGKNHPKGPNGGGRDADDIVVVSYSSISTNGFEPYGECVMGSRGTMIVEGEQTALLFAERDPNKAGAGAPRAAMKW
jgi:predicted dehydrogenase